MPYPSNVHPFPAPSVGCRMALESIDDPCCGSGMFHVHTALCPPTFPASTGLANTVDVSYPCPLYEIDSSFPACGPLVGV